MRGWPVPGRSKLRGRQRMHLKHGGRCTNWRCSRSKTGDVAGAQAGYEEALALARQLRDPSAEQAELHGLAELKRKMGDLDRRSYGL